MGQSPSLFRRADVVRHATACKIGSHTPTDSRQGTVLYHDACRDAAVGGVRSIRFQGISGLFMAMVTEVGPCNRPPERRAGEHEPVAAGCRGRSSP